VGVVGAAGVVRQVAPARASRALSAADAGPIPAAWRSASACRPSCPSTSAQTAGTTQWAWRSQLSVTPEILSGYM